MHTRRTPETMLALSVVMSRVADAEIFFLLAGRVAHVSTDLPPFSK